MDQDDSHSSHAGLLHLARVVSQTILISTQCILALEDAGLLGGRRARHIARSLKRIAQDMDDPDELAPAAYAQTLHQIASALEEAHPTGRGKGPKPD